MRSTLELVRKLGDGSAVEAFLGREDGDALPGAGQPPGDGPGGGRDGPLPRSLAGAGGRASAPGVAHPAAGHHDGRRALPAALRRAITGWTAADLLRSKGSVPEALVIDWGISLCEALSAAARPRADPRLPRPAPLAPARRAGISLRCAWPTPPSFTSARGLRWRRRPR